MSQVQAKEGSSYFGDDVFVWDNGVSFVGAVGSQK